MSDKKNNSKNEKLEGIKAVLQEPVLTKLRDFLVSQKCGDIEFDGIDTFVIRKGIRYLVNIPEAAGIKWINGERYILDIGKITFSPQGTGSDELDKAIIVAGYAYDSKQDIFYSVMDPWQRSVGYCRLYDEAAAPMAMIIDCEPVHFKYDDKNWMIGIWKGQYGMVTGGEIGIYTEAININIPGVFNGKFYNCASNTEQLQMSYTLKKNGKTLFKRKNRHWWLTGFKLGEFSHPSELTMDIDITLNDEAMRDAFITGIKAIGYTDDDLLINGNKVSFIFNTPHTKQPKSRKLPIANTMQNRNKDNCKLYRDITSTCKNMREKIETIKEEAPELYDEIIALGKSKEILAIYETIKKVLDI